MLRMTSLVPVGKEARLVTDGDPLALGLLKDGTLAVVTRPPDSEFGTALQVQRFNLNGAKIGLPSAVSSDGQPDGANAAFPALTPLTSGGFAVTWEVAFSHSQTGEFAMFDGAAGFVGGETFGNGYITGATAIARADGGVIRFAAMGSLFGQDAALGVRSFDTDGTRGQELVFGVRSNDEGGLNYSGLVGVASGDAAQLFWSDGDGLHTARFDAAGMTQERLLMSSGAADLDLAELQDGRLTATWSEWDGTDHLVYAMTFDPSHPATCMSPPPEKVLVGESHGFEADPEVVALRDGGFAISWHDDDADGRTLGRVYDASGAAGAVFDARGDFIGTDARGRVVTARVDADGDLFVGRYNLAGASASHPQRPSVIHLPDLHLPKIDLSKVHTALDGHWLL